MCMASIYKYYSTKRHNFDSLFRKQFWFSKPTKLNDLDECNLGRALSFLNMPDEVYRKYQKLFNSYGVCCFSEDEENENLWAHYAKDYSGFVVEYDADILGKYAYNSRACAPVFLSESTLYQRANRKLKNTYRVPVLRHENC